MKRIIFVIFGLFLLAYLMAPSASNIDDFEALPNSLKSTLSGDTVQVSNVSAYYSNNYRNFVTKFYYDNLKSNSWLPFGPLKLNHPPEFAYQYIKDQTQSTFLEEYTYPLRDSLFVNGLEPFEEDGRPRYWGATQFAQDDQAFNNKTTLRYYPSPVWARLVVWGGIMLCIYFTFKIGKRS
jgi:hypothetical protein